MPDDPHPWWAIDREFTEYRRRAVEDFDRELECSEPLGPDVPDPVVAEFFTGACWRELADARDDLARARDRHDVAVADAREAGLSWAEIARVLGVSKQLLHRRFGNPRDKKKPGATLG
ncbi:MAG: hypothetical protein ABWY93_34890 [Mycobacterium sp.]